MYGPWRQVGKYDPSVWSLECATVNLEPSLTLQAPGPDTDINMIARRYQLTGEMPVRRELGEYGEFDEDMDFQTLLHQVKAGEAAFAAVPSSIRSKFGNDPGVFLEWIHDDANYGEAEALGLVPKRDVPVAPVVPAEGRPAEGVGAE